MHDSIYLWDTDATEIKATFKTLDTIIAALAFSPNGKLLVMWLLRWKYPTMEFYGTQQKGLGGRIGQYLPTLKLKGHKETVNKLVFLTRWHNTSFWQL